MNSTQSSFIKYWLISPKSLVQLLLVLFCSNVWGQNIKEGFLNISDLHLSAHNVELSGEMRFYWGELLDYEQIKSGRWSSQIINSGNSWNNQPEGIQSHPNIGCGTYTFQLIIPEELVGERLIMRPKHFISYASKISVNGEICAQNGHVGSSKDDVNYKPGRATETVSFAPCSDTLSVVIQVANFHHFRGGIFKGIDIGTEQNMRKARERAISLDLFIIVSLLIMLLYHLILFAVDPKEYTSLFFAFVCLSFSLDLSMQGPMSFFLFFPEANSHFYIIMHLVVPYFIPATFFLFIYSLFPNQVSKKLTISTISIALGLLAYTVLVSTNARSYVIKPFYIYAGMLVIYLYYLCYKLLHSKVFGSRLFVLAYGIFSLCVVNDILNMFELIQTHNMLTYGVVVFVFLMSILYGRKNSILHQEAFLLTQSLKSVNKGLENKVKGRTEELNKAMEDLNELNTFQEGLSHLIANDLKNQLKGIVTIDYVHSSDFPALKNSGLRMLNMIQNMLDVYRYNKQKVQLEKSPFNVSSVIDFVIQEFNYVAHRNALKIEVIQYDDFKLNADIHAFKRVVTNLLSNAIQHSPSGGLVQIRVLDDGDNILKISFTNEGTGLSPKEQAKMFRSDNVIEKVGSDSKQHYGLGLALCKMAVELHKGKIGIESDGKSGVLFWIKLPGVIVVRDEARKVLHRTVNAKITLDDNDREYLRPFAEEINELELFETSKIETILLSFDQKNIRIKNWCETLLNICYTQDNNMFEQCLNQVLKPNKTVL